MSSVKKQPSNSRRGSLTYGKYKCQYKQKPILTKLNNDAGYPQEILNPSEAPTPRSKNNYVLENKKNLKNFFKERIPFEDTQLIRLMKRQIELIHPTRIFEMKQIEFQLKNKAKTKLQKELQPDLLLPKQFHFEKVNANFHVNDKNRDLKEKFGGKMNLSFYEEQNYRKGTQSHISKRSKILKKEAYDRVFGPDISALNRTTGFTKPSSERTSPPARAKSITFNTSIQDSDQHRTLRSLIQKMNNYKNKLEDRNQSCHMPPYDDFSTTVYEENLISMIKNMTKFYQGRSIVQGQQKIEKMEDLGNLYKQYYANLLNHKTNRLNKRRQLLYQTIGVTTHEGPSFPHHFQSAQLQVQNHSICSYDDGLEGIEEFNPEGEANEGPRHSVRYRFNLLKKTLVRWAALFFIYGIKRTNIFLAFKSNRQPYELEGSYAFFKCIKMGDLPSVKNFIAKNSNYIFETEFSGKTPLSYACINKKHEIAKQIIEEGVNSDKLCNNKKTSLFYALKTKNVELIKLLLQRGASPWSTHQNPYASMLKFGQNLSQISNLFNNARKIYLGMQIQPTIHERKQFWEHYKGKITEQHRLCYGFYE